MIEYDLVIRGGTIYDGSGRSPYQADLAIKDGRIAAFGPVPYRGREEIDASNLIVTPGFIDIHTHYDGQATWEQRISPSSGHGVTTVITGNCGVGFAPCRPADREKLIQVMEGVEDIPELVMARGIPWNWESFPGYLDALEAREFDIDIGVQIPHSPLRVFVMGDRGVNHEPSTDIDRAQMAVLVTEAIKKGAFGVSTSRSLNHRLKNGTLAPSVETAHAEVLALAEGLGNAGAGVFQIVTEVSQPPAEEMALVQRIAETSSRPVSFMLVQFPERPDVWRDLMAGMDRINAEGHSIRAQIFPRPVGVLLGLDLTLNPILTRPSYAAISHLPLAERVALLRDPELKARILAEEPVPDPQPIANKLIGMVDSMFELGATPNYAPRSQENLSQRAKELGVTPLSLAYDIMLKDEGHAILYLPGANFSSGSLNEVHEMMCHPRTVLALGDGGAHYGSICDASYTTFVLTYWTRDVEEERRFPLEWAIAALTSKPAQTVGLTDRGLLAPGYKADINIIDYDRLALHAPRPIFDLPGGGRRIEQDADGYVATIVDGVVTRRDGKATGALPGRLVRRGRYRPNALHYRQ